MTELLTAVYAWGVLYHLAVARTQARKARESGDKNVGARHLAAMLLCFLWPLLQARLVWLANREQWV